MKRMCPRRFTVLISTFIAAVISVVLAGLLTGCTPGDQTPESDSVSSAITVHYPGDERVFSPAHWVPYRYLVFATLMRWDENGEMQGWLADRWDHSEDSRTWTYHLRENALWHDGTSVTTADIEFTLGLLSHPDNLRLDPADFDLTVIDEHTFTVTAETPAAMGWMQWEIIALPKHLLENLDPAEFHDWDWWIQPVGNGPFRYVTHLPGIFTELEADPDYFFDGPGVDRIRLRYGGNGLVELMAGNIDVYEGASLFESRHMGEDPRFAIHPMDPRGSYWAIFWNQNRPQFRDAATRRALTLALDRKAIFSAMDIPEGVPILDAPNPTRGGEEGPKPLPFDPDAARRLLVEAGWQDLNGDGVLERDGEAFRFELLAFAGGIDVTVLVQADLRRVGVDVSILTLDMGTVRRRIRGGDIDAAIFRTSRGYLENYLFGRRDILEVQEEGLMSPLGYSNPTALAALEEAARSFDPDAEWRAWEILWPEFQRDLPVTYLQPEMGALVTTQRIRGIQERRQLMLWADQLWVEEGG